VFDYQVGRSGEHARDFLGDWKGHLVVDDYAGYKALFARGISEVGCMAHYPVLRIRPTPAASFSIFTLRTKASWPNKHCTRLAACTKSNGKHGT
jgi:hypothetical protein